MKLLSGFVSCAILSATIVSSIPITRRDVNETLVPQFGFSAGVNPTGTSLHPYESLLVADVRHYTGTGDCDGAVNGTNGQPVKIPCSCPPDRATFIQVRTNTSILRVCLDIIIIITPTYLESERECRSWPRPQ
jgi:hypothetical protein